MKFISLILGAVFASLCVATSPAHAQEPAVPQAPTAPAVPAALPMAGPAGMIFHAIKTDKVADFEAVMTRLRDLLGASTNETRRAQAAGWRVYKQAAPMPDGATLYISVLEPVVANAEYDVPRLLAEAAPDEAAVLYEQYRSAHVQPTVNKSDLTLLIALGAQAPAAPAAPQP